MKPFVLRLRRVFGLQNMNILFATSILLFRALQCAQCTQCAQTQFVVFTFPFAPTMVSLLDRHSHNSNEDETHLQTKRTNLVHLAIIIRIVDVSPKSGPLAVHVVAGIIVSPFISPSPNKIGACSANLVDVLPKSGGLHLVRMSWRV